MAKLTFIYSSMGAGKSAQLLQAEFNYRERGMKCLLLTAAVDNRYGTAKITSRLGISADAQVFREEDNIFEKYLVQAASEGNAAILVDEAQFLTRDHVSQLCQCVDLLKIPVLAYGLRSNFKGELFEGSQALMALSDNVRDIKTICHCGRQATMVLRKDPDGKPTLSGGEVQIGGEESYVSLCRRHWMEAHGLYNSVRLHQPLKSA